MHRDQAPTLSLNEIGRVSISLSEAISFDQYKKNRSTGAFIIIDRISYETVGAGVILDRQTSENSKDHWSSEPRSKSLVGVDSKVSLEERSARFGQKPVTVLLTGLPGSGKSTTAYGLERSLFEQGRSAVVLDGQNIRLGISRDLGFTADNRSENVRRCSEIAKLFNDTGMISILSLVAPSEDVRKKAASAVGDERFLVVHLNAPAELCRERNSGEREITDQALLNYEPPVKPDLVLNTDSTEPVECVAKIIELLEQKNILS